MLASFAARVDSIVFPSMLISALAPVDKNSLKEKRDFR